MQSSMIIHTLISVGTATTKSGIFIYFSVPLPSPKWKKTCCKTCSFGYYRWSWNIWGDTHCSKRNKTASCESYSWRLQTSDWEKQLKCVMLLKPCIFQPKGESTCWEMWTGQKHQAGRNFSMKNSSGLNHKELQDSQTKRRRHYGSGSYVQKKDAVLKNFAKEIKSGRKSKTNTETQIRQHSLWNASWVGTNALETR